MDKETRRQALANYLEVELEDVVDGYDDETFECNGEEYRVLTDEEADEAVVDSIESIIDDIGLEAFTPAFQDWVIENALDNSDWFDEALKGSEESYVYDLDDDDLIEELKSYNLLTDDDFHIEEDEDGDEEEVLNDNVDLDSLKEDLVYALVDNAGDAYEWFKMNFGEGSVRDLIKNGTIGLDIDDIAYELISWDGRGNQLSGYDGQEIELDDNLYAYRTN